MPDSLHILQKAFLRECHSLVQYVDESWPWSDRHDAQARQLYCAIRDQERHWAAKLADLLLEREGFLPAGNFPVEFADLHFLALEFFLPKLANWLRAVVARLEEEHRELSGDEPASQLLAEMIDGKKKQIAEIERLLQASASPRQ